MKKYLVIQLARFGDLVQTKRLILTLQKREMSEVHLCVDSSLATLASLIYPRVIIHEIVAHATRVQKDEIVNAMFNINIKKFACLKLIDFNQIFNLNYSPLNFRLAALFDYSIVRGYAWKNGQELIETWPAMAMRWSGVRRVGINLVDFWAAYCPDMVAPESVNPQARAQGGGVGVVLAGRESRRSLPVEVLSRIISAIANKYSAKITLLGSFDEQAVGQAVVKTLPVKLQQITTNMAGKTNWQDLVEIVSTFDTVLTPDTGTMHLAAHLGVPTQAFFLSSAWCFETGPYGRGHTIYQASTGCLPCLESQQCPYEIKCLNCFDNSSLLRFLNTHKEQHVPDNMIGFTSDFDSLGQTYTAFVGSDPHADQRQSFRSFLYQYLKGDHDCFTGSESQWAHQIFRERDWITYKMSIKNLGS